MLCRPSCILKAINKTLFSLLSLLFLISQIQGQEFFNNLENSSYPAYWINTQTSDSGFAHSGYHYSVADSMQHYGLGIQSEFPEEMKGKNLWVKVEGWVKSNKTNDHANFVISLINKGQQVYWRSVDLKPLFQKIEAWYYFSDSIKVPASVSQNGQFKAYLWNSDGKDIVALDDLKIEFGTYNDPTYIPNLNIHENNPAGQGDKLLFSNSFYSIYYSHRTKSISLYGISGDVLINNIWYYDDREIGELKNAGFSFFSFDKMKKKSGKTKLHFSSVRKNLFLQLVLEVNDESPEIWFTIKEKFRNKQSVSRESIVIQSNSKLSEVYRANRKSHKDSFQSEYWLGKQGVKFGVSSDSWLIYHQARISSMQLNTEKNQLWINLDYEKDHPFLHFPLQNDTMDYKLDWSESIYKRGNKREYTFSIIAGLNTASLPRIMKNPGGYLATYIWTEHADFTNIRTNRATYFGSENIKEAENATGGFVKYNIPVTKSVFFNNPDNITNSSISSGMFNGFESAIEQDSLFYHFLKQIKANGTEICLHTPENFTTTSGNLKRALRYAQYEFASPTWIDHGYNNGIQNNREDLVCDGTLRSSKFYAVKRWEKYGLDYFWNPYYEDYFSFRDYKFGSHIDQPYSGFGDFLPNPDYWRHKSRSQNIIHWPTKTVLYVPNDYLWDYNFNDQVLNDFVDNWSVEINHCYPAWVDPAKGFWVYVQDSTIVAAPGFNRTLEKMAALKDNGKLNVTTIKNFLDYQVAIENLQYEILNDGRVKITNNTNKPIEGLSFATKAKYILVDDQIPEQKTAANDIVFWFDLPAGENRHIRIID